MPVTYHERTFIDDTHDDDDEDNDNEDNEDNGNNRLRPQNTELITDPDPDDAIVLSDLVRTGEASRLRRRGAMRIEHHHYAHAPTHQQQQSPTVIMVAEPTWESDGDDQPVASSSYSSSQYLQRRPRSGVSGAGARNRLSRRYAYDEGLDFSYVLFCGGEEAGGEDYPGDSVAPFVPSPFPNTHTPQTPPRRRVSGSSPYPKSQPRRKRTNGCGALIHLHAAPRPRSPASTSSSSSNANISTSSTWIAHRGAASTAVVPVEDPIYLKDYPGLVPSIGGNGSDGRAKSHHLDFRLQPPHQNRHPQRQQGQQQRSLGGGSCECVREAIACAICGNILGRRLRGCKASSSSNSNSNERQDESVVGRPEGMRYWREGARRCSRTAGSGEDDGYMYTFLASAVSSSPSYRFPTRPSPTSTTTPTTSASNTSILASAPPAPASSQQQPMTIMSTLPTALPQQPRPPSEPAHRDRDEGGGGEYSRRSMDAIISLANLAGRWEDLDRLITTASPTPLSDEEREVYRARAPVDVRARYSVGYPGGGGGGGRYRAPSYGYYTDADGDFIEGGNGGNDDNRDDGESESEEGEEEEPGSPEKTGDAIILNR